MPLFFSQDIFEDIIHLDQDESRHLSKVLRLTNGDQVQAVDGKGNYYHCVILEAHSKNAQLKIQQKETKNTSYGVHIAAAPTKNLNRWEWFLEKATEIGIDEISPLICQHSERKVLKMERQKRVLVSAMKQSKKAKSPQLNEIQTITDFLKKMPEGNKYIAHCREDLPKMKLSSIHQKGEKAVILIGPEGDFSKEEILAATAVGFKAVSLGPSRLRTETAALIACHTINLINA